MHLQTQVTTEAEYSLSVNTTNLIHQLKLGVLNRPQDQPGNVGLLPVECISFNEEIEGFVFQGEPSGEKIQHFFVVQRGVGGKNATTPKLRVVR